MKHILILVLLVALMSMGGCASRKAKTVPMTTRQAIELTAEDVVKIMLYAGFDDDQILDMGTDLRNGLALNGAIQMIAEGKVRAVFAVLQDGVVHVSTMTSGAFAYSVKMGKVIS